MRRSRAAGLVWTLGTLLLLVSLAEAAPYQARPGGVAGRVVDFDGTPLPGIGVELLGPFPENTRRRAIADGNLVLTRSRTLPGRSSRSEKKSYATRLQPEAGALSYL